MIVDAAHARRALIALRVALVAILVTAYARTDLAGARDPGQWDGADPALVDWYRGLRQPDNPSVSCCGEADAYWADTVVIIDGKVFAVITDERPDAPLGRHPIPSGTRFEVPPHKMIRTNGNPTGHAVIFLNGFDQVLCYVTGSLS